MKTPIAFLLAMAMAAFSTFAADNNYPPGPDSKPQDGVPKGQVLKFALDDSKFFPGTHHDCSVYVPAEYSTDAPACLYVSQDGIEQDAPTVFDNLIYRKEMPVTIGVFIKPGIVPAADKNAALDRFNRSYEYDGLGDNYARFLLEEVLPAVEKMTLPDGRAIKISPDPNDHAIGGQSSGAICAFTVAWERPDAFRRVFSAIGTYVDLRGGLRYPSLIRKFEPKPIRIFMQDGTNDNNKYGGDWFMANQTMRRALEFAGYDVTNVWGTGTHNGNQATMLFPDAMRWLWRDWPAPITPGPTKNDTLTNILIPGEDWQLVGDGYGSLDGPAVNTNGEVYFNDTKNNKTLKIGTDGQINEFLGDARKATGQIFGPDGRLYANATADYQIVAYAMDGTKTVLASDIRGNDIVVARNGNVYVTDPPPASTNRPSYVWLIKPGGEKQVVDTGIKFANGIALSPDQSLLYVTDYRSHWVYSFVILPGGTLADKQRYCWLHERDVDDDAGADGMRADRDGRLYVTTRMGIQVCDQAGRVQCILPTPNGKVSNLCFGGPNFDTLCATCGDKLFKRKLHVAGANGWADPNKPAAPRL